MIVYFTRHGESVANVADRECRPSPRTPTACPSAAGSRRAASASACAARGSRRSSPARSGARRRPRRRSARSSASGFETDEDLYEVRQSDAYRAASPNYAGTGHVSWMPDAPARARRARRGVLREILAARRARPGAPRGAHRRTSACCASRTGASCTSSSAPRSSARPSRPQHLPALYRISHINTGITLFEQRRDYLIEGIRFDGWALQTWNDQGHL